MAKKQLSRELNPSLKAFLRIKHPSIDPSDITQALGLQPEHAVCAGTDVSGSGVRRLHSESYWLASVEMESRDDMLRLIRAHADRAKPEQLLTMPELTRDFLKAWSGVSTVLELRLVLLVRQLQEQHEFLSQLIKGGGSIVLLVQKTTSQDPITLSPMLMRSLADLSITVEID